MLTLSQQLRARSTSEPPIYRPHRFQLQSPDDAAQLEQLLRTAPDLRVVDTIDLQLADLVKVETCRNDTSIERARELILQKLAGVPTEQYGTWVYYPWSRTVVHVLPEDEFRRVRSDRNRYKIAPTEQATLHSKLIGVAGLSVGRAAAITAVLEGVGGRFRIADYDALDLSNLNRLAAGLPDIGVNKAVLAARHMYEIDPYIEVEVYPEGISSQNLDAFLTLPMPLDLLIEECDDLYMKVRLRERARDFRIPVVMDTSDRGLVDVERFDREPDRPILHGLVEGLRSERLVGLSAKDKVPFVLRILDATRLSSAFSATLIEIQESTYTWPQLASGVALGGALVTDVARRVLLDQFRESGRYYVDIEQLIRDGQGMPIVASGPFEPEVAREAAADRTFIATPSRPAVDNPGLTIAEVEYLVKHAVLAPSGGNTQPWQFGWDGRALTCSLHPERGATLLDFERRASILAIGAALENVSIAASALGLACAWAHFPDGEPAADGCVARAQFTRTTGIAPSERLPFVTRRVTNRRYTDGVPLGETLLRSLVRTAEAAGAMLRLCSERRQLEALGALLGRADQLRFLSQRMHRELIDELRWTARQTVGDPTGIDVASLELDAPDAAGMQVLAQWRNLEVVQRLGLGSGLGTLAKKALARTEAFALLSFPERGPSDYLEAGQVLQRVWLDATALEIAVHPWTSLLYLAARAESAAPDLSESEVSTIRALDKQLRELLPVPTGYRPMFMFRLSHAAPPTSRSLRLPLAQVLHIHDEIRQPSAAQRDAAEPPAI